MSIHTKNPTLPWRQKWELMVDGKHTEQYFHTWHNTKQEAYDFVVNYIRGFGDKLPRKYYRPFCSPSAHSNKQNDPIGTFIKDRVITLAPL